MLCRKKITYKINEIIEVEDYDTNVDNTYSSGIHYFKTIEYAFYYEAEKLDFGMLKIYYNSGKLQGEINYENNKKNGLEKQYYKNGRIESEINYKNDERNGSCKQYYENGLLNYKSYYENG